MTHPRSFWSRPIVRLCAVAFAALFIAAPTPGNVGGCGSGAGGQEVAAGDTSLNPPQTSEYMYFDQGLCSFFCLQLRNCSTMTEPVLCDVVAGAQGCLPPNSACTDDSQCCFGNCLATAGGTSGQCGSCNPFATNVYEMCVRQQVLRASIVGQTNYPSTLSTCPHACPAGYTYHQAYQWDVEACGDAILNLTCNPTGPGSIGQTFQSAPSECLNVCQCDSPSMECTNAAGQVACTNTLTDSANCGGCGAMCQTGQHCNNGSCQ
jgi:hypothetical protein